MGCANSSTVSYRPVYKNRIEMDVAITSDEYATEVNQNRHQQYRERSSPDRRRSLPVVGDETMMILQKEKKKSPSKFVQI